MSMTGGGSVAARYWTGWSQWPAAKCEPAAPMSPGRPRRPDGMNITEPAVAERAPQPYVSIPRTVTMATISSAADELPGLLGWLGDRGGTPSGPPVLRYTLTDMERGL